MTRPGTNSGTTSQARRAGNPVANWKSPRPCHPTQLLPSPAGVARTPSISPPPQPWFSELSRQPHLPPPRLCSIHPGIKSHIWIKLSNGRSNCQSATWERVMIELILSNFNCSLNCNSCQGPRFNAFHYWLKFWNNKKIEYVQQTTATAEKKRSDSFCPL